MAQASVYVSGMRIPPPAPRAAPVRRGYAMMLMIVSSVIISFGGLIVRSMEEAGPSQINFWRSLALIVTFGAIFLYRHKSESIKDFRKVGFGRRSPVNELPRIRFRTQLVNNFNKGSLSTEKQLPS